MLVRGNGFCLLNAVDLVLYCDYNEVVTVYSLASNILEYLIANVDYYKQFHTADVLQDAEGYLKFENYCDNIIDVIIFATTKGLHMNLSIYQKGPDGNIQVIEQTIDARGREVYLKSR